MTADSYKDSAVFSYLNNFKYLFVYINAMNYDKNQMDDISQVLTDAGWTVKEWHNNLGYYDSSSEGNSCDNAMYKLAKSIQAIYKDSKTGYYYEINVIPEIY